MVVCFQVHDKNWICFYKMEELYMTYLGAACIHTPQLIFTYNRVQEVYSADFGVVELQRIIDSKNHTEEQKTILDIMYHALCCQNIYDEDLFLTWKGHLFLVGATPVHLLSTPNPLPILLGRIRVFIDELNNQKLPDLSKCNTQYKRGKHISRFDRIQAPNNANERYKFALRSHEIRNFIIAWSCNGIQHLWGREDLHEPHLLRLIMQFIR